MSSAIASYSPKCLTLARNSPILRGEIQACSAGVRGAEAAHDIGGEKVERDDADVKINESIFFVSKMDCPSEERLIRLALAPVDSVAAIFVDFQDRRLRIQHSDDVDEIKEKLLALGLGAALETTHRVEVEAEAPVDEVGEALVLKQLLVINGVMFAVELVVGVIAESTGLIADSLDMFADAVVYGLALFAVGRAVSDQRRAAKVSGWVQMMLALLVLIEVGRKALFGSAPQEGAMIGLGVVALIANLACIALLAKHREGGVHLRASWIFTTNDALANLGVILAGVLVAATGSSIPDLVIGTIVALLVLSGAARILRLE